MGGVVALPLSVGPVEEFLSGFAYRIDIQYGVFVWAVLIVLAVVTASTGVNAWLAARESPVDSLNSE